MRGLLQFIAFLTVIFFVVGELLGGWFLGVPPQTPVFVYKKSHAANVERRALMASQFTFSVEGEVRRGTVTVEGFYERPPAFRTPASRPCP